MLKEQNKGNSKQQEQANEQMAGMKMNTPKMPNMSNMKMPNFKSPKL